MESASDRSDAMEILSTLRNAPSVWKMRALVKDGGGGGGAGAVAIGGRSDAAEDAATSGTAASLMGALTASSRKSSLSSRIVLSCCACVWVDRLDFGGDDRCDAVGGMRVRLAGDDGADAPLSSEMITTDDGDESRDRPDAPLVACVRGEGPRRNASRVLFPPSRLSDFTTVELALAVLLAGLLAVAAGR